MNKSLSRIRWIALAGLMTTVAAWAADSPIGSLAAQGKVSITGQASSFTLTDQEYAYFSGDKVSTDADARAMIRLSDGLDVALIGSTTGRITSRDGAYTIDIESGHALIKAAEGVDYQIVHNGNIVPRASRLDAADGPYVASVSNSGEVEFYMPAQLDSGAAAGSLANAGLTATQIAAIVAAAVAGGYYIEKEVIDDDDEGPSS